MGQGLSHWRVIAATAFSVALIALAYFLARSVTHPPAAQASEESALLAAIATKDSTGDGLPDWEKSLYGIPLNATTTDYFHLGMTDGEAVAKGLIVPIAIADASSATTTPGAIIDPNLPPVPADNTLTASFAKNLFVLYMQAKQNAGGAPLTDQDLQNVAQQALANLSSSIARAPDFKSARDLLVKGSGADAMKTFAASAETVMEANKDTATTSELIYLRDAVKNDDPSRLPYILSIAKSYRDSAAGIAMLPVPQELAGADLALINALARVGEITSDFARVSDDPVASMLALEQYPTAVLALADALTGVAGAYKAQNITLQPGTPGASFVNIISDVAAAEAAQKQ